jgi:hypothetical protein
MQAAHGGDVLQPVSVTVKCKACARHRRLRDSPLAPAPDEARHNVAVSVCARFSNAPWDEPGSAASAQVWLVYRPGEVIYHGVSHTHPVVSAASLYCNPPLSMIPEV